MKGTKKKQQSLQFVRDTGWLNVKIFRIFSLNISGNCFLSSLVIRFFLSVLFALLHYCIWGKTVTYSTQSFYTKQSFISIFQIIIENVEIVMKCIDDC